MEKLIHSKYFNTIKGLLNPTDIYSAISPLYYLSKILGLAPFYYRSEKPEGRIQISLLGTLHSCFMCSVLMALLVVLFKWHLEKEFEKYSLITDFVSLSDSIVSSLGVIISYALCATINRRRIKKLLFLLSQVDTYLVKTVNSYKTVCVSLIVGIVLSFLMHVCCIIVDSTDRSHVENYEAHFIYCLFSIIGMTTCSQFVYAALLLKHRFRVLNEDLLMVFDIEDEDVLDDMQLLEPMSRTISKTGLEEQTSCQESLHQTSAFEELNCSDSKHSNSEQINELSDSEDWKRSVKITVIREVHFILCEASELTNSIFQVQILVGSIEIFLKITVCLYGSLTYVTGLFTCELYSPSKWNMLAVFLMWATINLSKLIAVTASCDAASEQANHAAVLVQKLLVVQSLHPETTAELQVFSQQLLHRKVRFTACGFFPIDFTLLYNMAGSVTTYLIILLQYNGEDVGNLIELCNKTFSKTV